MKAYPLQWVRKISIIKMTVLTQALKSSVHQNPNVILQGHKTNPNKICMKPHFSIANTIYNLSKY